MTKKITKKVIFILILMIFGGLGGIIADRYFFPYLSATKIFSRYEFLKKGSENTTIINKTEQVVIKEETSISKITNQVSSAVVNIISYPDKDVKNATSIPKNGTGVIVTGDGIIMSYASAINLENSKYKIMTYDGNVYEATLLGVDSYSNLAFLKADASNLSIVSFADSDSIKAGEKVVAVANSSGSYANRYSAGLIGYFNTGYNISKSVLASSEKLEGVYEADFNFQKYFIGGPVVDYNGQVVGITGVIERDNVQNFFLIPSNKVKTVIDRAIKKELELNPVLGVYYVPLSETYAIENNMSVNAGALIYSTFGQQGLAIIANSPAQKAGLKLGDIIKTVEGDAISLEQTLPELLYKYKKGDSIRVEVLRGEQQLTISVQL